MNTRGVGKTTTEGILNALRSKQHNTNTVLKNINSEIRWFWVEILVSSSSSLKWNN